MEKLKIFLFYLIIWSSLRAISFIVLSLCDFKKCLGSFKEFITFWGVILLGVIMLPFKALFEEWWFFVILTFLYFLFGGGSFVFWILLLSGFIIANLPVIIGFFISMLCSDKR